LEYVSSDPATRQCAIIDPVLDFDEKSGSVATTSADAILRYVAEQNLTVQWILVTDIQTASQAAEALREKVCFECCSESADEFYEKIVTARKTTR
jgi:hypothetical protein